MTLSILFIHSWLNVNPVKMSFFSISDPIERERVVQDYQKIRQEIRKRDEDMKLTGQNRNRILQETFHPVVKAQEDMAERIVKSLKEIPVEKIVKKPVKQEMKQEYLKTSKKIRLSIDEF